MTEHQLPGSLEDELRHALRYLYDPRELRKSQLLSLLSLDGGYSPLTRLRRALTEAVEALRPEDSIPHTAHAWRVYNILTYRFIELLSQQEVADDLCLSVRQLRRDEQAAIRVLGDYLSHKFGASHQIAEELPEAGQVPVASTTGWQAELDWLRLAFPCEAVGVRAIIESALSTAAPLIESSQVTVSLVVASDLAPVVGQFTTIRQALLNVLSAAVQAVAGGQVKLRATADQAKTELVIRARRPDGTAIPDEQALAEAIAISQQLLELGGGSLDMVTADGGSTITLLLPTALPKRVPILVVDDNADTLQLFRRYLAESVFDLSSVLDPEQAVSHAAESQPDVIVLDVMLPGIDGWELLGRLREHPQTQGIPIVICTILPQEQLALALGAAAFLQKPFTRESLCATLTRLAGQREHPSPVPGPE